MCLKRVVYVNVAVMGTLKTMLVLPPQLRKNLDWIKSDWLLLLTTYEPHWTLVSTHYTEMHQQNEQVEYETDPHATMIYQQINLFTTFATPEIRCLCYA